MKYHIIVIRIITSQLSEVMLNEFWHVFLLYFYVSIITNEKATGSYSLWNIYVGQWDR